MLIVLLLTLAAFGLIMLAMAVGSIFQGRCLRGSCGGPEILTGDGVPLTCDTCPLKKKREAELRAQKLAAAGE
ncbi:MAG: Na(+)-translocating NADH-quinone reductase subunit E [Acidobacteriota bacterium]